MPEPNTNTDEKILLVGSEELLEIIKDEIEKALAGRTEDFLKRTALSTKRLQCKKLQI